ncbi:Crp/Fnr family transcriptional regulator [Saprospira sp. CCB-QB6]|uniref:Crp/Fnr family transcriptional regulator n=1 Tax=Saprospira sp. CCB-QB6 TaxID=3023936 RepID=UPI00234927BB|nr:Crp/Fnr family transcriptional regulator [Saprospira sp. CCB-QB6]WCL82709.1 Crp/Fnr family transcriptional regulator [Saprospira sp. CCB-QB6]
MELTTHLVRKSFPLLTELELQNEIVASSTLKSFEANEMLMDYGDYIRYVPLVIEGSVKVLRQSEDGNELFLYYLNGGDTCAMAFTCCMMRRKSEIRTITEEPSQIIFIPLQKMEDWMGQYHSWREFVMTSYNNRFEELFTALDNIAFLKMDERLLRYLASKARSLGQNSLSTTHQEIARELNASREAVSRLLKKLERNKLLKLGRNRIDLLLEPEELENWNRE